MSSAVKPLRASLAMLPESSRMAVGETADFRVRIRSRPTLPVTGLLEGGSSTETSQILGAMDTLVMGRRSPTTYGGRWSMTAQGNHAKGLVKKTGPIRWHSPAESRECGPESRRATASRRQAAGGLLERSSSTEEEQDVKRGLRVGKAEESIGEGYRRIASARLASGGLSPQLALPRGLEMERLLELGCEQSKKQEGERPAVELRGSFFSDRPSQAADNMRRRSPDSEPTQGAVDLGTWLPPPKERLIHEALRQTRLQDGRAKPRSGRREQGFKDKATPRALAAKRRVRAARAKASVDGPSTSGRQLDNVSLRTSRQFYSGALPGSRNKDRNSGFQKDLASESEEDETRKLGTESAGERITYESLKADAVETGIRIERQLLRDGLLVSQARALALYVIKNEIPGGYDAIKERLSFLQSLNGLKPKQAVALLLAQKRTLKRPVVELEGNVAYLLTAGVPIDQLGNVVRRSPQILLTSVQARIEPSVRCLRGLGLDVGKMIVKNPRVVTYDLEGRAREVIGYLNSIGLGEGEVQALLEKDATLLTMTIETLAKKVEFLFRKSASEKAALDLIKSSPHALYADVEQAIEQIEMVFATFGLEVGDTFRLLSKWPALMSMTKRPMLEKVEFVINELGWSVDDVLQYPLFLSFSLEKKLRPRCEKVLRQGIVIAKPKSDRGLKLHTMLVCSDENFEHYLSEIWPNKYRG